MPVQLTVAKDIIAQDGVGGLYKGLGAGLLRQATYTTARLGIFQYISDYLKESNKGKVRGTGQTCQPAAQVMRYSSGSHVRWACYWTQ